MKKNKKTRVRAKYSVLCLKRTKLTNAAVYVAEHKVWALVKGKVYADGRFKYIYNGKEAIADPYQCIPEREGLSRLRLKEEIVRLNIQNIERNRPKKKKKLKAQWVVENDQYLGMLDQVIEQIVADPPPIVAQELP